MDKREAILARLQAIAGGITGVRNVFRNQDQINEKMRPAIMILDADEQAEDNDGGIRGRPSMVPSRVGMTPEIYIMLGAQPKSVGSEINLIRAALIKAILSDADLIGILGSNGGVKYEGCATDLAAGRQMEGAMGVSFTFSYVLNPADL